MHGAFPAKLGESRSVVGVKIFIQGEVNNCTGVVVGMRSVLLADHCLYLSTKVDHSKLFKAGEKIQVYQRYEDSKQIDFFEMKSLRVQSANDRNNLNAYDINFDQGDFAIVTTSKDIGLYFDQAKIADKIEEGDTVTAFGYGDTALTEESNQEKNRKLISTNGRSYGQMRWAEYPVDTTTFVRFRSRIRKENLSMLNKGDSGGPAMIRRGHEWFVAGINSKNDYLSHRDNLPTDFDNIWSRVDEASRFGIMLRDFIQKSEANTQDIALR